MFNENPCLTCGACCAHFRVSFHWSEADTEQGGVVPPEMTEDVTPFFVSMRGTNQKKSRCIALMGHIGQKTSCAIYEKRPSPCRDFGVQWEDGLYNIINEEIQRCNHARAVWGLPALFQQLPRFNFQRPEMHREKTMVTVFHRSIKAKRKDGRKPGSIRG
ncbi:MAG: hypothetical protein CVU39_23965 [Chloroflexi bacterium HGW-Chloroflexi-10]|nr:MAG: hypothetical protein CVU39_23965 [Chloroflexi bacterium HGW-Chloroflexi-10]